MTKREQQMVNAYEKSKCDSVRKAYVRPSKFKINAEEDIKWIMNQDEGKCYKVTGYSCMQFSCAYKLIKNGINYLKYFTKDNEYLIALNENNKVLHNQALILINV